MIRRLVWLGWLLLGGCGLHTSAPERVAGTEPMRPNIVILFADDLGYGDLGSYGHPYNRTPALDQLAREGQRWTDFYAAAPVCSPSRGALLTGKLPVRSGLYGRRLGVMFPGDTVAGIPEAELTLAEALRGVGYRTAIIGKWHLGDAPPAYPTRHGFDYWYGLPYSNDMGWARGPDFPQLLAQVAAGDAKALRRELAARRGQYLEPRPEDWDVPLIRSRTADNGYIDEVLARPVDQRTLTRDYTRQALDFIRAGDKAPFLLYLPYTMPHTPLFTSDAFAGRSRGGPYGDVIEELDWSVGEIRRVLEAEGQARQTLVIFTSDNGPWLPMRHHGGSAGLLHNGKGTTFEGGMRVPALFWWPGTVAPAVVSGIGSTLDIYNTALALAGATAPADSDGFDLTATLKQGAPSPRDEVAYYRADELQAFRKGPYKLRLVSAGAYGLPPQRVEHSPPALFNLTQDPGERFDIGKRNPQAVAEVLAALQAHRAALQPRAPIFDRRLQAADSPKAVK
ncbi:sulfatase [Exilibacterium tricleocarpae]|uniref:Sulfatase n=1 Tax=Exilibacterium tricleocarpae TaxID=2591008 RepID=A0A545TAI9_9GAMM|nr:sulfatase [Exilibacterium tricleocarpae]TQV74230.1 sulfatase [Exilibacterium tricleocarpae]